MAELETEIAEYETRQAGLEAEHMGKWVLLREHELVGLFSSFEAAAGEAVKRFGRGPYLIRQIGARPLVLPASVMYQPTHGQNKMRI